MLFLCYMIYLIILLQISKKFKHYLQVNILFILTNSRVYKISTIFLYKRMIKTPKLDKIFEIRLSFYIQFNHFYLH